MKQKKALLFTLKSLIILFAACMMGMGVALFYTVNIGADPYSVFTEGISLWLHITPGNATTLFNCFVVLIFLFANRRMIHMGTLINAVFVGTGINLGMWAWAQLLPQPPGLLSAVFLCILASVICGNALALYLACDFGASAVDMTILALAGLMHKSYKWGFYLLYAVFLLAGALLGGRWGVGTLISLLLTGAITDCMIPRFRTWLGAPKKAGESNAQ